jgi:type III pantothenate kinase
MFLAIDIGNTNITCGLFKMSAKKIAGAPVYMWRLETSAAKTADEYGVTCLNILKEFKIDPKNITAIGLASVVPALSPVFTEMSKKYLKKEVFVLSADIYNYPAETGADRIANAIAAFDLYKQAVIVIDFGTATTFDCVNSLGKYIGGVIAPGPRISATALAKKTAQLPFADIKKPKTAIGQSTMECIESGLYYGYIGLIKEILSALKKELPRAKIVATGGLADMMSKEIKDISEINQNITLNGICIAYQQWRKK